jgi:hypothetical protein
MVNAFAPGSATALNGNIIGSTYKSSERDKEVNMTWNTREAHVQGIKKATKPTVPLIIRPLQLPRHTYKQVSLCLYRAETGNLVYVYLWKQKKRIAILKRSWDLDL